MVGSLQPHPVLALIAYLLLVIGLIFLSAWLAKRSSYLRTSHARLRLCGQLSLGLRERLLIVQVDERQLLLSLTPGRIQLLTELEPAAGEPEPLDDGGFAARLRDMILKREKL